MTAGRARAARAALLVAVVAGALLAGAAPAGADEPGESTVASELVRQAIALIVNTPDNMEAAREKVGDALEVDNREGVDIALVRQADEALAADDLHQARTLLEESIGARSHLGATEVAPIGEVSEGPAVGAEAGEAPILDPLDTGGLDGGDAAALGIGVTVALIGVLLAWRLRPVHIKAS